ncbi:MAG: CooT family nickel-binding protein [Deltaproteobacteria bacterium]|nr:CooT family nickel-binding protein [Deltaproteobacteria bacterium]MBW1927556.1 CooT family nickel-binding protein [Deltaproteobacteria bacterium]MBW2124809.1 CooT family nickel-binding protein [Deltaproteobacteria bacterium]RLB22495.1 MAG: RNA-binding protein [Deltaproteobacteria bacterium]
MCESSVYIVEQGEEKLLMENVELLENKNGILTMVDLFGEKKDIKATVRSLSLVDHRILVEPES